MLSIVHFLFYYKNVHFLQFLLMLHLLTLSLTHSLASRQYALCIFQHIFWQQFFFSALSRLFFGNIFQWIYVFFFVLLFIIAMHSPRYDLWIIIALKIHFLFARQLIVWCFIFGILKNTTLGYFLNIIFSSLTMHCIHASIKYDNYLFVPKKYIFFYRDVAHNSRARKR